ncbi:MAG: energy transducer TonB [Legionellales bacterium]|jgi:protein TonB
MLVWTRSDAVLFCALLASIGLHLIFFWQPMQQKNAFQAPAGQSMAITLGTPPVPKKEMLQPTLEELIITQAEHAIDKIIPKKPEPEITEQVKEIVGELEELIVTREVQLSQKPVPPIYPEKARRERQEGLVLVRAQVDHLGKTHEVIVSQSSGFPLLDEAAIKAVSKWSFLPAKENDQAIAAWIEVPIDFKLR